jgi:hypothetical protein
VGSLTGAPSPKTLVYVSIGCSHVFCQGSKLPSVVNVGRSLSRGQGRTMFPLSKKKGRRQGQQRQPNGEEGVRRGGGRLAMAPKVVGEARRRPAGVGGG